MMRMQPNPAFSGDPVTSDSGSTGAAIAIELSDVSVTFGRGERAVPALSTTTLRIADGDTGGNCQLFDYTDKHGAGTEGGKCVRDRNIHRESDEDYPIASF